MRRTTSRLAAGALLVLAACGGGRNPPSTDASIASCSGQRMVIVTNDWNEAVEVYATVAEDARRSLLGIVTPGQRAEFGLPEGTKNVSSLPARSIQPSYMPPAMRQLVRFRYSCR